MSVRTFQGRSRRAPKLRPAKMGEQHGFLREGIGLRGCEKRHLRRGYPRIGEGVMKKNGLDFKKTHYVLRRAEEGGGDGGQGKAVFI